MSDELDTTQDTVVMADQSKDLEESPSPTFKEYSITYRHAIDSAKDQVDYTPKFWKSVLEPDDQTRKEELHNIITDAKEMLSGIGEEKSMRFARAHISNLKRIALGSPFDDVREMLGEFVDELQAKYNVAPPEPPPPSTFVPASKLPSVDTTDEDLRPIFEDVFFQYGRVSHMDRFMAWHPSYFREFCMCQHTMMNEGGPLPRSWRHYIAMLAATRHKCEYLIAQQEEEFLEADGDVNWLKGVDFIPKKIRNLLSLNQQLAHQPWLVTTSHIEALVKGEESWSIAELVHAITIMCTFHSLCGVVYSLGINLEITHISCSDEEVKEPADDNGDGDDGDDEVESTPDTAHLVDMLRQSESGSESDYDGSEDNPPEENEKMFDSIEYLFEGGGEDKSNTDAYQYCLGDIHRYVGEGYDLMYTDFDVKEKVDYQVFRVQDYCWKDHGYALMNRFYSDMAPLVDKCFVTISRLTYHTLGGVTNDIDTQPFRRAVWYYVHRVMGMFHDDYNYREVNEFLNRPVKCFVKAVVCYPERMASSDFHNLGYSFKPSEKCHITLLAIEARRQASLLYGLHSVMKYML